MDPLSQGPLPNSLKPAAKSSPLSGARRADYGFVLSLLWVKQYPSDVAA